MDMATVMSGIAAGTVGFIWGLAVGYLIAKWDEKEDR